MATRFKASELQEMIRSLVRQEIKQNLASMISEVFSERYLKKLAESAVAARPRGVSNLSIQGDDVEPEDDEIPEVLGNSILGVGQDNPVFKKVPKNDHVRQHNEGIDRNEILSMFFEGTKPINEAEEHAEEGVALPMDRPEMQEQASKWKDLLQQTERLAEAKKPVQRDQASEEARLKRLREQLDVKVG